MSLINEMRHGTLGVRSEECYTLSCLSLQKSLIRPIKMLRKVLRVPQMAKMEKQFLLFEAWINRGHFLTSHRNSFLKSDTHHLSNTENSSLLVFFYLEEVSHKSLLYGVVSMYGTATWLHLLQYVHWLEENLFVLVSLIMANQPKIRFWSNAYFLVHLYLKPSHWCISRSFFTSLPPPAYLSVMSCLS